MYRQILDPVGDSLALSAIFAVLPLAHAVRAARRAQDQGVDRRVVLAGGRHRRGDRRLLDAGRPDAAVGDRGRVVRLLPDPLDRDQRDLGLQPHGRDRALRRAAPVVLAGQSGPAHPGRHHRVLLRCAARGARRLRHSRCHHRCHADGAGLPAGQGRLCRADRQHRTRRLRCAGDPDRHPRHGDLRRQQRSAAQHRHAGRDGRPADADPRRRRTARPRLRRRRSSRSAPDLAARRWWSVSRSASRSSSRPTTSRCSSPTSSPRWSRAAAVVALLRVWTPCESPIPEDDDATAPRGCRASAPSHASARRTDVEQGYDGHDPPRCSTVDGRAWRCPDDDSIHDTPAEVARAYAPYLIIIAIFAIVNIGPIKTALAEKPWTYSFDWPGLNVQTSAGDPQASMTYTFNWLPAPGTLMIIAGLITMVVLKVSPARGLQAYKDTYVELRWAILTVMAVLGLAYVMNQSGQTGTLGALLAETGGAFLAAVPDPRLARRRGDRVGHVVQRALRRAAGADRDEGRARPAAARRCELLRWRARQDDQSAEPRDRRRRRSAWRAGGRHPAQGASAGACCCWC